MRTIPQKEKSINPNGKSPASIDPAARGGGGGLNTQGCAHGGRYHNVDSRKLKPNEIRESQMAHSIRCLTNTVFGMGVPGMRFSRKRCSLAPVPGQ